MHRHYFVLSLSLLIPLQAAAQQTPELPLRYQVDGPFVALFEPLDLQYSSRDVKSLRSTIEKERGEQTEICRKDVKRYKKQLEWARKGLKALNAASARDTRTAAGARSNLHSEIAALEINLRDKKQECEHTIPAIYEIKLSKVDLIERWPRQRDRTDRVIEEGRARQRKHGDVDDIGYRKLADDQEKDITAGEQAFRQMSASGYIPPQIQDSSVRNYVQDLATKIARRSDLKIPLHVSVLDSADINAIALPGGYLLVTSGLVLACETEAEFAGVLSQQIARIAARHATRVSKRTIMTKALVPAAQVAAGLLTGGVTNAGAYYGMDYGFQGLNVLTDKTLAHTNSKAQKEADQLGIQYAWNAGFDPKGFISFLDSIAKNKDQSHTERFLLTKPELGERLLDAFTEIQFLPNRENLIVDSTEFRIAKERLQNP
jgi:Zn-dependent protease with chaperone function